MRIKNIQFIKKGDWVVLQADCSIRYFGSDVIYFKINRKYENFIYRDASPFAAALLLPAMRKGEDLIIEGAISKKLYQGMKESMKLLSSWNLGLKTITIKAAKLTVDSQNPQHVASFFSGGVDSFYTYLKNKNNKDGALSHLILVNGYDINLTNKSLWEKTLHDVKKIASQEHIEVIEVETNVRNLTDPICEWDYTYSAGLAAVGLMLRNNIKKVYRASSYSYKQIIDEMDMVIDRYFDTEKLSVVHDGAELNRVEKVIAIAHSQLVLENLRVCYLNQKDTYNCGKCDKCLRTMINLFIAGKLSDTKTFTNTLDMELVKNLTIDNEHGAIFHKENLTELKNRKLSLDLQRAIEYSLKNFSKKPIFLNRVLRQFLYVDHVYTRGLIRNVFGNPSNN